MRTLMTGIAFGECPRWHDGRLWFCDWAAEELIAVDLEGKSEVIGHVPSFPFSIDWLPAGRLVIVSGRARALLRMEDDGSLRRQTDLSGLSDKGWNEIVVDGRGNVYVNGGGFDLMAGEEFGPGDHRPRHPERRREAGGRRDPFSKRDGRHPGQRDVDHRRVLRQATDCV